MISLARILGDCGSNHHRKRSYSRCRYHKTNEEKRNLAFASVNRASSSCRYCRLSTSSSSSSDKESPNEPYSIYNSSSNQVFLS